MKRFQFSLQRVLDVRQKVEEAAEREWAARQREEQLAREGLARAQSRWEESLQGWDELSRAGQVDPLLLGAQRQYALSCLRELEAARQRWEEAEEARKAALARLMEAMRDREALETLREHEAEEYRLEVEREERSALDEVSTVRHWRSHHGQEGAGGGAAC